MTDQPTHHASIRWSPEQQRQGLPNITQTADPAWHADERPVHDEGWTLLCDFATSPTVQGNPSVARVRYLMPNAPHRLVRGLHLRLFERGTGQFADVEILD
jgi:hypothetical protein